MTYVWQISALIFAVLYFPAWLSIALLACMIVFVRAYVPSIVAGLVFDLLYFGGTLTPRAPFAIMIPLAVHCLLLSLLAMFVRSRMREHGT